MSITVRVHSKFSSRVPRARLTRVVRRVLRAEKARGDVAIYLTTDSEMRLLNRKLHATDAATDVLAFPPRARRGDPRGRPHQGEDKPRPYMGDIIISYETARANARRAGWRIADE